MSKNQSREFWRDYYQKNKRSLARSSKTCYHARKGKHVFWVKPPHNYNNYCINNNLKPKLF